MNAFHSTNLFCCFSRYQAPANSVAPPSIYKPHTTHNSLIRSDEGLTLETSASESLYGGQLTLSTQLIDPELCFVSFSCLCGHLHFFLTPILFSCFYVSSYISGNKVPLSFDKKPTQRHHSSATNLFFVFENPKLLMCFFGRMPDWIINFGSYICKYKFYVDLLPVSFWRCS